MTVRRQTRANARSQVLRLQEELKQVEAAAKAAADSAQQSAVEAEQRAAAAERRAEAAEEALGAAGRVTAATQAAAVVWSGGIESVSQAGGSAALQHPPAAAVPLAPASIGEFCSANGLERYAELMVENEIDLDVLPDLGEEDWEELGVHAADLPRLLAAVARLCQAQQAAGGASGGVSGVLAPDDAETAGDAGKVAGMEGMESRERAVREREEQAGGREREVTEEQQAKQGLRRDHDIELQDAESQHVAQIQALMMQVSPF